MSTERGDILIGKIASIEGLSVLEACSAFVVPPSMKLPIVDLRNYIKESNPAINCDILKAYSVEIIDLYLGLHKAIMNPTFHRKLFIK